MGMKKVTHLKLQKSEIEMCMECYVDENRITPLLNPLDCLENHTQYICGTWEGAIALNMTPNVDYPFGIVPFKSLEILLYLRTVDYSTKSFVVYELKMKMAVLSDKIFADSVGLAVISKGRTKGKLAKI